jgi:hypothetical protein
LTLTDNWGPEVVTGFGFDSTLTEFDSGTLCDDLGVNVAVHEPLTSVTLTAEFTDPLTEFGARAVTGSPCFTVSGVRFPDQDLVDPATDTPYPSNFGYIEVDLEPAVATTTSAAADALDDIIPVVSNAGFAYGDAIRISDTTNTSDETLIGFIGTTSLIVADLTNDQTSGSDVYWRGPIQNGYASVTGTLTQNTSTYQLVLQVADATDIDVTNGARISSGQLVTSSGTGFFGVTDTPYITLDAALSAAVAPAAAVAGYNVNQTGTCNTTLTTAPAAGATTFDVVDATGCAVGDPIVIDFGDVGGGIELRTISVVTPTVAPAATLTISAALTNAHAIGETVDERVSWSTTAVFGYPTVYLGSAPFGFQPGSSVTFTNAAGTETDTVTITSIQGIFVQLGEIPTDSVSTPFAFVTGDTWSNNSSRSPDALEVQLQDRSGNDSDDTDTDGDGIADYDEIGYETVDGAFGRF